MDLIIVLVIVADRRHHLARPQDPAAAGQGVRAGRQRGAQGDGRDQDRHRRQARCRRHRHGRHARLLTLAPTVSGAPPASVRRAPRPAPRDRLTAASSTGSGIDRDGPGPRGPRPAPRPSAGTSNARWSACVPGVAWTRISTSANARTVAVLDRDDLARHGPRSRRPRRGSAPRDASRASPRRRRGRGRAPSAGSPRSAPSSSGERRR